MCKYYLYECYNDIRIALNDVDNDDMYPDHIWKLNWDNFTEILIYVTSKQFRLSPNMLEYVTKFAKSIVGKDSHICIDKVQEYAKLITGLIDYGYVYDTSLNKGRFNEK